MLTEERRNAIRGRARAAIKQATLRRDTWWAYPFSIAGLLILMIGYLTIAGLQTSGYFADPYLSPLYSPCLAVNCEHTTFAFFGPWFTISPFVIVGGIPIGFRITCYYYRKAYYRSLFFSPPACAVAEPLPQLTWSRGAGETRFPHIIVQNLHRYFFYLMLVNMVFLTWDTINTFFFPDGFGVGVGTLVFVLMIVTMAGYVASCHSCRHAVGGRLDRFSQAPLRHRVWKLVSRLNEQHGFWALGSLVWIAVTDLYVRLVAAGTITDLRIF